MLELGPKKGTIISHRSKWVGDKIAISILCDVNGERADATIFVTDKAMGMARRALKMCGFDVDQDDMALLDIKPTMLAGNVVPLVVTEWKGKQQVQVDINSRVDKRAMSEVTAKLRAAKSSSDEPDVTSPTSSKPTESIADGDIPF